MTQIKVEDEPMDEATWEVLTDIHEGLGCTVYHAVTADRLLMSRPPSRHEFGMLVSGIIQTRHIDVWYEWLFDKPASGWVQ